MAKMIFIGIEVFKCVSNNQNYYFIIINWAEFHQVKVWMNEKEGDFSPNIFILKIK
jgi:heme-degrading monooxygenase HmoA